MTRSAAHRTSGVQVEKSLPPISSDGGSSAPRSSPQVSGVPWYWRLVLFLWATSFGFMLLYEWLAGIIKAW